MRHRVVLVLALVSLGLLGRAPAAWSCSCGEQTTAQAYRTAAVVFIGMVTAVEERAGATDVSGEIGASFAVHDVFKGSMPRRATISTFAGAPACGFDFVAGKRYVVFASGEDGQLKTDTCSGTTPDLTVLSKAGFDKPKTQYSMLEDAVAPLAPAGALPVGSSRTGMVVFAFVLAAVALASLLVGRFRMRRSADLPGGGV